MLRLLLKLTLVLALLWSGWWALATWGVQQGIAALDNAPPQQGWETSIGTSAASGFPLRIGTDLTDLQLEQPAEGLRLTLPALALSAPTYWPGDVTLALPDRGLELALPGVTLMVRLTEAEARLRANPGTALTLDRAQLRSGPWQLNSPGGNLLSGADLRAGLVESDGAANRYRLALSSDALSPGDLLRGPGLLDPALPQRFENFEAALFLTFAEALDRQALEGPLPALRGLEIEALDIHWGDLRLTGEGALSIDPQGVPEGQLVLTVANWQQLADLAARLGFESEVNQARIILQALANRNGEPQNLALPLRFEGGQMYLDAIALGPAPRLTY